MEIKKKLLKSLIWTDNDILYMVSHHVLAYFWVIVFTVITVTIAFFSYDLLKFISWTFASWTVWIFWIVIYIYILLNFLDIYFDAIVVTEDSIIVYKWFGLFKSTTDVLEFHAIESVFFDQEWIVNVLFNNGNIFLKRTSESNVFQDVHNPAKIVDKINTIIKSKKVDHEEDVEEEKKDEDSDFKLFIEAMAEIIKDYKNK